MTVALVVNGAQVNPIKCEFMASGFHDYDTVCSQNVLRLWVYLLFFLLSYQWRQDVISCSCKIFLLIKLFQFKFFISLIFSVFKN